MASPAPSETVGGIPWFVISGCVAVLAGLAGLVTIGYWYTADMGWTGSGSTIVQSRIPIGAAALVAVLAVVFGVVTVLVRHDVPLPSLGAVVLLATNALVAGAVLVAVDSYPQVEPAELIGIGPRGSVIWQTELPVTEVFGVRSEKRDTITLEGRADRRACDWKTRSVTLDRSTGAILDVHELPTEYASESDIPPEPTKLDRDRYDLQQGSAPFICRN